MTNPRIAIDIVSNDKSSKGVQSAEKRIGNIPRSAGAANQRMIRDSDRAIGRSSRSMLRTLGAVEQAGAKLFGGRSITSGLAGRLGAIGEAASATGSGLREASAAGGLLEGAMTGVGVAVGATVGLLAAAAFGAFKLADGWAKGAASIGRTADTIGVSTKALQEFSAAAERAGVDKDKATGSLGSLSQTLNDARYGRNSSALAVLGRLGVGMKLNDDGTVNIGAMLPALADAIARQNSSGRRTVAHGLGIDVGTLPAFTGGGKQLAADMADADTHAAVLDSGQIATGTRIARKGAMVGQLADRAMSAVGSAAAGVTERGYDAALAGGTAISDGAGRVFSSGAAAVERGGRAIERAAVGLTSAVIGAAQAAAGKYHQRASISLAQYGVESGYGRHMPAGSNNPFGIKAHGDQPFVTARTREVDRFGRSYYVNAKFRKFASLQEAFEEHDKLLAGRRYAGVRNASTADEAADALGRSGYATDPRYARSIKRELHSKGLERYDGAPIPVKVEIDARGLPSGTRTKVTAGHGSRPAISHAMSD